MLEQSLEAEPTLASPNTNTTCLQSSSTPMNTSLIQLNSCSNKKMLKHPEQHFQTKFQVTEEGNALSFSAYIYASNILKISK